METVLILVAAVAAILANVVSVFAYLNVHRSLAYLVTAERISAAQREQEAQTRHQRSARVHKLSPPSSWPDGKWKAACSCGWISSSWDDSSDCLDEMEQHKSEMLLRRTG